MAEEKKKKKKTILTPKVQSQLESEYKTATGKDFDYNKGKNVKVDGETLDPLSLEAQQRSLRSAVSRSKVPPVEGAKAAIIRDQQTGEQIAGPTNIGDNVIVGRNAEEQLLQQQAQQVGQITPEQFAQLSQEQQQAIQNANPGIDIGQALSSGLSVAIPSAAGAATVGAVGGAAVGGLGAIPGAIGGAVLGAVGGFIGGVIGNLKSQAGGKIEAASQNVEKAETNLRALVQDTNMNPANAARNIQLFNYQLARLDSTHNQLQMETRSNINKFLGKDGTPQLERFEIFNSPGGARGILISQMQTAVLNPNPSINLITVEDIQNQNI